MILTVDFGPPRSALNNVHKMAAELIFFTSEIIQSSGLVHFCRFQAVGYHIAAIFFNTCPVDLYSWV